MANTHEHGFQQTAVSFISRALPGVSVWSIDCGWPGANSPFNQNVRMSRRRRGVKSGYPDLFVLTCPMITFELKDNGGVLSDDQLARRDELIRAGHHWFGPTKTLEQIEAALLSLGYKLAATVGGIGVAPPRVSARREASFARLHDALPF